MKKLRITSTTATFITGLARIIREHLNIPVGEHECWTFEQAAEWVICGSPGHCSFHDRNPPEHSLPCHEHQIEVYLGVGHLKEYGNYDRTELRVRIEHTHNDAMGELYTVLLWAKRPDGQIACGSYGLLDDGHPYPTKKTAPPNPPKKIAFWKDGTVLAAEVTLI